MILLPIMQALKCRPIKYECFSASSEAPIIRGEFLRVEGRGSLQRSEKQIPPLRCGMTNEGAAQ